MMALAGVELETLVSKPDALTTRPLPCAVFFELKTGMSLMNEICLVEIRIPEVRHLINQSGKSKILRDHELVNEIKLRKGKFQQK